jgi:hypothetical protein
MLGKHAENKGGGFHVEPAIEEMCSYMKRGVFFVANHMTEFAEEFLNYHRDEDYKIVKLRDDLGKQAADPSLRRQLAVEARRRLNGAFDIGGMLKDLEEEYGALLRATDASHLGGKSASH